MEILFCFSVVAFFLWRILYAKSDPFHPVTLVLLFNFLTLGVAHYGLSEHWVGLQPFTWFAVLTSSLSIALGKFLAQQYTHSYELTNQLHTPRSQLFDGWNWNLYYKMCLIVMGIFLLGLYYRASLVGGIPIFQNGHDHMTKSASIDMGILNIYMLRGNEVFAVVLLGAYKRINPHFKLRLLSIFLALVAITFSFMFFQSRLNLMTALGVMALYHHYFVRSLSFRHFVFFAALILGLFVLVATLRFQYLDGSDEFTITKILRLPYLYVANNWWNLDYGLNPPPGTHISGLRWGYGFIEGASHMLPGGTRFAEAMQWDSIFNESVERIEGLNTITWHWQAYQEFGYFGLTIAPFIFGVLAEFGFNYFKRHGRFEHIVVMSVLMGYFTLSWFEEFYQNGLYIWRILFVWVCIKFVYLNRLTDPSQPDKLQVKM